MKYFFLLCYVSLFLPVIGQVTDGEEYIVSKIDSIFTNTTSSNKIILMAQKIDKTAIIYTIPCISPVRPLHLQRITISSKYGQRIHPISGFSQTHRGIDLPSDNTQDTIYAPAHGVIDTIGYDNKLGFFMKLRHRYHYDTIYGHLSQVLLSAGTEITIGTPIAIMGNTGLSTGRHLHYQIMYRGYPINPLPYCYLLLEHLSWKIN